MAKKDFKKELSKELMYKKIMPSAGKADPPEKAAAETEVDAVSPPGSAAPVPQESPATAAASAEAAGTVLPSPSELFSPGYKPIQDSVSGHIMINLMESLVDQRVDDVIAKFNCCNCPRCRKDAIALALNKLPPKYVVGVHDQLMDFTQHKAVAEILTALIQAVLTVRANPRHDL